MLPGQWIAAIAVTGALFTQFASTNPVIQIAALSVAGITLVATRALPEIATALVIFLAFLHLGNMPPGVVFSGFATGGFWLLVGGLVIGSAIASSGLGDQIATRLFAQTGTSFRRAIFLLSICGVLLAFLVPSAIPRVIILMPITVSLARIMGHAPGTVGYAGLTITAAMMTLMPTYGILTANLPTIVQLGAIEALYAETIGYGTHLALHAPISILRFGILLALMLSFRPGKPSAGHQSAEQAAPFDVAQRRLLILLSIAVALWASDVWHGISPGWITLGVALVLLVPGVGVLGPTAMKEDIDLSVAFLIAGVFCISAAIAASGLDSAMATYIVPSLRLGQIGSLWDLFAVTGFSAALSHLTTAPAAPVGLAPLAGPMADATGWSVMTVAMAQSIGFSTSALPHQAPPILIAMAIARIPYGPLLRVCAWSSFWALLLGIPLTWAWWGWLGLI